MGNGRDHRIDALLVRVHSEMGRMILIATLANNVQSIVVEKFCIFCFICSLRISALYSY